MLIVLFLCAKNVQTNWGEKVKIGIMQPYLFPYIGYFSLINYCDKFIFFDTPQYISHGWVNRNRIIKQDGSLNFFIVPIQKCHRETPIKDIKICNDMKWKEKIYGQLTVYKKKAPNYEVVREIIEKVFEQDYGDSLSRLSILSVMEVCRYLNIRRDFSVYSNMGLDIEEVHAPDEWALNITQACHGDIYVNPPGGMSFFDRGKYQEKGIELQFLRQHFKQYVQKIGHFEPALSIIDIMMFCSVEEIIDMLNDFEIL
jgi:hypothetical protein